MIPRVLKTVNLPPGECNRATLHEIAANFAEEEFERKGACPAVWIIGVGNHAMLIETPWENDAEKFVMARAMRSLMQITGTHAYACMGEAYVASAEHDEDGRLPSERPENERDEILFIVSYDNNGDSAFTRYLVYIRPKGYNRLGLRIDEPGEIKGALFGNMLARASNAD